MKKMNLALAVILGIVLGLAIQPTVNDATHSLDVDHGTYNKYDIRTAIKRYGSFKWVSSILK